MPEGHRTFANVMKYLRMATGSSFGNMFSTAGASLFLPFLPVQILLNDLIYGLSEPPIPTDRVEAIEIARPQRWDLGTLRRFVVVAGVVSSVFDFVTFFVLLRLFHADEALFHTGWFVESMATQILVIFVIRTWDSAWRSRPSPLLAAGAFASLAVAVLLPYTGVGRYFGFVSLSPALLALVAALVGTYLALADLTKRAFRRHELARGRLR